MFLVLVGLGFDIKSLTACKLIRTTTNIINEKQITVIILTTISGIRIKSSASKNKRNEIQL